LTTHGGTSIKEALHIIAPMPANAIARPSSYSAETRRNICEEDGKYKKIMNRTNNGLERYNRHYNELFPNTPSLFEFCEVIEEESRRVARKLRDIDSGQVQSQGQLIRKLQYPKFLVRTPNGSRITVTKSKLDVAFHQSRKTCHLLVAYFICLAIRCLSR